MAVMAACAVLAGFTPVLAQTTFNPELSPPALMSPAADTTNLPAFVTLSWENQRANFPYRLQLATDSGFTNAVEHVVSGTQKALGPLLGSTTFYWRVARTEGDTIGPWSAVRRFAVGYESPTLSAPVLIYPPAAAVNVGPNGQFRWNHASGALWYQLQVSTSPTFDTLVRNDSGVTTLLSTSSSRITTSTEYFWRLRGFNALGAGPWSEVWSFVTVLSAPPKVLSPADSATSLPTDPVTFTWASVPSASSYRLRVSLRSDFQSTWFSDTTTGTSVTLGSLLPNTMYYWRVSVKNAGRTSTESPLRVFTTGAATSLKPRLAEAFAVSARRVGGETVLRLNLTRAERVTVRVRTLQGRLAAPVRDEVMPAGAHNVALAGTSAGVAVVELRVGQATRRLVVAP